MVWVAMIGSGGELVMNGLVVSVIDDFVVGCL